jgi:NAD(P)-dependent dehydrogenase (short-subunit alcohol dehydrogenase family)
MRIIIVGASGVIGKKLVAAFGKDHEVVTAGSKSGDFQVDIHSPASIEAFYKQVGSFDAVVATAGGAHFGPLTSMTDADFRVGLDSKLMGQVNLVLIGQHYINDKGSFTLTSGSVSAMPIRLGGALTPVNRAIEGFVAGAAIELERGVRINAVSPTLVEDSPQYVPFFPGVEPVSMDAVVRGYQRAVLGPQTGLTIEVW